MNNIKYVLMFFVTCLLFASCEKYENSAEPSSTTFLPKITLEGETSIVLDCNATGYTAPGAKAEEQGQEITLDVSTSGVYFGSSTIDGPDRYEIAYSAANKDGIPGAATRKILWPECNGDLVTSIAGMYTAYLSRLSVGSGAVLASPQYQGVGPIIIKDLGNNMYALSDAQGGWYEYGRSLGIPYATLGQTITANDISANDFTFGPGQETNTFGGVNTITSLTVDAAAKEIIIVTEWEFGFVFTIRLVQND